MKKRQRFFGGLATTIFFLLVSGATAQDAVIHIDVAHQGHPISKYVYGQFIEHFGDCIDIGLWAEIMRDRKFFDAVGDGDSPWKASGAELTMDENDPFTGKWTPVLALKEGEPGVLYQENLRLRAGVDFVGYLWVRPSKGVSRISVSLGGGPEGAKTEWTTDRLAANEYQKLSFSWTAGTAEPFEACFSVSAEGTGTLHVGCVSLMPSDNIDGMRADTIACLQELNSPIYRWPGGNFVSGYNWKDGIGDRDRRPPRKNPAWPGIEMNDFGFDEFMHFCDYLKTEPYVAVNTGDGQVDSALQELEYALGSPKTPFGKIRAENGHQKPYEVRFWGIGNEMYGDWQIGHMPVEEYVKKNNLFADAFHAAYPDLFLIGVGNVGGWNDIFIPGTIGHIEAISEHFYTGKRKEVLPRVQQVAYEIKRICDAHDQYRYRWQESYAATPLPIAMDEWNYANGPSVFGQAGIRFDLLDGLGIAEGLHQIFRRSDLFVMANYAQTINVLGAIKVNQVGAQLESTGLVLALYRKQFGEIPVMTRVNEERVDLPGSGIDALAALTPGGKFLTVAMVNPFAEEKTVALDLFETRIRTKGHIWRITDRESDPKAFNDPEAPQRITIGDEAVNLKKGTVVLPPYSVNILKVQVVAL
jgi:alpha-N-arabinofuranosidase